MNAHQGTVSNLKASLGKKDVEIEELRVESSMAIFKGFEQAKEQVKILHPNLLLTEIGRFKEIVDGKLVEVTSPDENNTIMILARFPALLRIRPHALIDCSFFLLFL